MIFYLAIGLWHLANRIYRHVRKRHSAERVRRVTEGY